MRRMLCVLVCLLMVSVLPASSEGVKWGSTIWSGDYNYELDNSNGAIITTYLASDTELNVPSTIDGHPVKAIGPDAFYQDEDLVSIVLPEGLLSIGDYAFRSCSNLSSIV